MIRGHSRRFWWLTSAAGAVLMALAGWFLAVSPQLSAASDAELAADDLALQNQTLRSTVQSLEQVDVPKLRSSLVEAAAGLPSTTDLPTFTRQVTQLATGSGVAVDSITIGAASTTGAADAATDGSATTSTAPVQIPVTVTTSGVGTGQRAFLTALQTTGSRRALVISTSLSPSGGDDGTVAGRSSMITTFDVFTAPLDAAAQAQLDKLLSGTSAS